MPNLSSRPSFAFAGEPLWRSPPSAHQQTATLIRRYPALSKPELERLLGLFPRLSALDMSLLMADAELSPKLEAFCAAHRARLGPSFADLAVIGAILSAPILILLTITLTGA